MPTKTFPTQRAIAWLKTLVLPEIDRLELDYLLADLEHIQHRVQELDKVIAQRCEHQRRCRTARVHTRCRLPLPPRRWRVVWVGSSVSLVLTAWPTIGGSHPGCRNSGENNQRLGSITKAGSGMARWLLAQVTHQVLRKDTSLREWFKRIKRRRGATIARVAVVSPDG